MKTLSSKLPNVGTSIFSVMSQLAAQHDCVNLGQGFPNFDTPEALKALVQRYVNEGYNQYAPMPGLLTLREQLARKIEMLYRREVDPVSEITITAGATQAIFTTIAATVRSGDEVIVLEPAYDSYAPSVMANGGTVIPYTLKAPDYRPNWEELARLFTSRTRMIVINTPHNPTGTVWREADFKALEALLEATDTLLLSDEVYEHLTYDGVRHESVLRYPRLFRRSFATFSFGKTFHNTGWKMGYCVAPEPLMEEFRKVHQFNVFSVNHPVQRALADYLREPEHYLSLPAFYQQKRDHFTDAIAASRLRPLTCAGTYFRLFDYSAISDEPDIQFARRLVTDHGVAAIPVSAFNHDGHDDRVIRLCFAKTEETLDRAAKLLNRV